MGLDDILNDSRWEAGTVVLAEPPHVHSIEEIVDMGLKQQTVARRLEALADAERINQITVGRGSVWWVPAD